MVHQSFNGDFKITARRVLICGFSVLSPSLSKRKEAVLEESADGTRFGKRGGGRCTCYIAQQSHSWRASVTLTKILFPGFQAGCQNGPR